MISEITVKTYCGENISLIENYELAVADNVNMWECHHRLEIQEDGTDVSLKELKSMGLYWNRPASELIFLTKFEHMRLHHKGNQYWLGKHHSEETKRKMSEVRRGKPIPKLKGRIAWNKGKPISEEHRRKISEARKAYLNNKRKIER